MALFLHLLCFVLINLGVAVLGYQFIKHKRIELSWLLLLVSVAFIYLIFRQQPPMLRMLAIIAITFTGMKVVAVAESYKDKPLTLTLVRWLVFAMCWAGMRAQPFETLGGPPIVNAWPMIRFGISRMVFGSLLIAIAHAVVATPVSQQLTSNIVTPLLLVGFSLILHFGLLSLSAGMWRLQGVNTYYLFRQPAKALSLTEFWSKRWNIAFSEMTSVAIFRPLKVKIGAGSALMLAFIFSGLLHELALSLPVSGGYGLPLLYFIIQGCLVFLEKTLLNRKAYIFKEPALARAWVFFWLVAPMPLLFHTAFIKHILWPLAGL